MGSAAIFRIYGTLRKFVFTSSRYRDAVIAATHQENAPEDCLTLFLEVAFPPVEIKVMCVSQPEVDFTWCFYLLF